MRQEERPMMPNDVIAVKRAKEKGHQLGNDMIINGVKNSNEDNKLPCEKMHVSSNFHEVPLRYINTGYGEATENVARYAESTNRGKSSTKRYNKSNRISVFHRPRATLQKSPTRSCEMSVVNRNGVACRVSQTEASPKTNAFVKDTFESKMSVEPESEPLPQTLREVNSREVSQASFVQSSGNFHKNTRSFGNRSRAINGSSKNNDSFRPVVHGHHTAGARVHPAGHRNVPYPPKSFDLTSFPQPPSFPSPPLFPPPPLFPFPTQHSFHPSANFPSTTHMPQWNFMHHQRPTMRNVFNSVHNRQFHEHMHAYRPCYWGPNQHEANNHGVVDKGIFTPSPTLGDLSKGSWYHNTPLPRKYIECTQVQNSDPTRDAFRGQIKARSTIGNMKDHKHEKLLSINNERSDQDLKQSESLRAKKHPSRISAVFGQSTNEQSSRYDTLKKREQKQTATNLRCKDSDDILEEDCFQSDRQQTSHVISEHSRQNGHLNPNAESPLNRRRQETEQFMCSQINNTKTNCSQTVNPVIHSYTFSQDKDFEHGRNSPDSGKAVNNCEDIQYDIESTNSIGSGSKCSPVETNHSMSLTLNVLEENSYAGRKHSSSQTEQNMDSQAFSEAHEHSFKSNIFSVVSPLPSLLIPSVNPSHANQSEHTKDHYLAPCFKEIPEIKPSSGCTNGRCRDFGSQNGHFTSNSNIVLNNTDDVTEQISKIKTVSLNISTSNLDEDITDHCIKYSGRNDSINDIAPDVCESNAKQGQTKDVLKHCHVSDATSKKLNPGAASFSLAINDEIEQEMERAQSMLIPVNIASKKSFQLVASPLNPDANDFCPKLLDSHGKSFVMTKQKGISYFQPEAAHLPVNKTSTSSDSNQSLDTQSMASRTCTSGSVFSFLVSLEDYDLTTYNSAKIVDNATSQTYDQQMESSQYFGHDHQFYTNPNTALIDASVISQDVYLTDAIVPSPIATSDIPEFSYCRHGNHFDPGSIYSTLHNPYYHLTSPYTDHLSTPHFDHFTDNLPTEAWREQLSQTEHFESSGFAYYSLVPMYVTSSPVASSPMMSLTGTEHIPVSTQTQPVPCLLHQAPFPAHALTTQYRPSLPPTVQSTNQMSLPQTPVLNLHAYFETNQGNSSFLDANTSDEIYVENNQPQASTLLSNPRSFVRNIELNAQYSSVNEEIPTKNEQSNEKYPNSLAHKNQAASRLVGSTACPLIRQVDHDDDDAQGRLTINTASSNEVSATAPQASPIFPKEFHVSEYEECKLILERLKDKNICLDHIRRIVLLEPEFQRRLMEKWMEKALRIIEGSQNKLSVDEMAASMFWQIPKISGSSAST